MPKPKFLTKTAEQMTGTELIAETALVATTALVAPYAFLALMGGTLIAYDKAKAAWKKKFPNKK